MKSTLKPRKRRLKSVQATYSDHYLVSIVAPSIELFNKIHEACSVLENFGIPYETTIVAAHRSPNRAIKYASNLEVRGIEVVLDCGTGSTSPRTDSLPYNPSCNRNTFVTCFIIFGQRNRFFAFYDSDASRGPSCHGRH